MMFSPEIPTGRHPPDSLLMTPATPGFPSPFATFPAMWMPDWTQLLNNHPEMGTTDLGFFPNFAQNPFGEAFRNGFGTSESNGKLAAATPIFPTPSRSGGRKPKNEEGLSSEEIEKRTRRRERNKEAAARCRQRRLDLTETLVQSIHTLQMENHKKIKEKETIKANLKKLIDVISSNCLSHLPPNDVQTVMNISREFNEIDNKVNLPEINVKEEFVEHPRNLDLTRLPILHTWCIPGDFTNYNAQKDLSYAADAEPTDLSSTGLSSIGHVHDFSLV